MSRVFIFPHKAFMKSLPLCSHIHEPGLKAKYEMVTENALYFFMDRRYFTSTDFLETKWGCQ